MHSVQGLGKRMGVCVVVEKVGTVICFCMLEGWDDLPCLAR